MNCRGEKRRVYIVANYDIEPIAHLKLLNGRTIKSDAGGDITDSYFIFKCVSKKNKEDSQLIYCGKPTAIDFCRRIGKELPHIFNPIAGESQNINENRDVQHQNANNPVNVQWNPVRKQLYNAVMLFISARNIRPDTPLFNIKLELERNVDTEPKLQYIKAVNTIISRYNTSISQIMEELCQNNNLRHYDFSLLTTILDKNNIEQYFVKQ